MEHNNLQEMLQSFMQQQQQMIQQTLHQNAQVARQEMQQEIQKINQGLLGRFEHVDQRVDALIEEKQKSDQKVETVLEDINARLETMEARTAILEGEKELTDQQDRAITHPSASRERKTIFMKEVEETTHLAERRQVVVQMPTPSHSHIFLNSMDLADYAQFVTKWFDWQVKYGVRLEPALIVSQSIRNLLNNFAS
mmetsp:Transcript_18833/g.27186  ORF Transcript_18833/g.27186 Transcript_18833/m.27186 type:complete len:196 (+) Transcript_18833:17-604(+)